MYLVVNKYEELRHSQTNRVGSVAQISMHACGKGIS
jgi:hypothetical protein